MANVQCPHYPIDTVRLDMKLEEDDLANYWDTRWQNAETKWDLRQPSPPLMAYADQIPADRRDLAVLIPGCGNGYEALYLLENGFTNLTMLDIAPTAIAALRERLDVGFPAWSERLQLWCGDFFKHQHQYELILEQTFFCALPPDLRPAYVLKMNELLHPGGKLTGVWFNRPFEGGPPFGGDEEEYRALFAPHFRIKNLSACYNSIPPRAGSELFGIFEKTGAA